ncbi:DUF2079 domain-containing protein, partial [Candidatus Dependentiae bacterium]|nr:DUF2079 domain-containing protein [Candidatus Dependentiae bacterium]
MRYINCLLFIFLFVFLFIFLNFSNLNRYTNNLDFTLDLGYFANLINNTNNGDFFYTSFYKWNQLHDKKFNSLGDHSYLILVLFSPLLILFKSPIILQTVQQVILILSSIIIFKIALHFFKNLIPAFLFFLIFLLNPHLQYLLIYDFHPEIFSIIFISS